MTTIEITGVTGATYPIDIYVCDVYGAMCFIVATIPGPPPPPPTIPIILPYQFDSAPAVGIKIIDSGGCEKFEIYNC